MSDYQRQLESAQECLTKLEAELVSERQTRRSLEEELNLLREKLKQEERDHCEVRARDRTRNWEHRRKFDESKTEYFVCVGGENVQGTYPEIGGTN